MKATYMIRKYCLLFCLLLLCVALTSSFAVRYKDFSNVTGIQNLEASYHVLLTIKSIQQNPVTDHWYLPTVSLGQENDKNIPWGATLRTKTQSSGGGIVTYIQALLL